MHGNNERYHLTLVTPHIIVAACPPANPLWSCHSSWDFLFCSVFLSVGISGVTPWSGPLPSYPRRL